MKFLRAISDLLRFHRTNWKAFVLCLFAAAVFWIFNALNKNYSTNLSLPLKLAFDDTRFAPAEAIPEKLTVNVNGIGWELLRKSLGQKVPVIELPLERPTDVHRIPGATLAPQVISQIGTLQLNYVVLDTLRLAIEPKVSRKLKLMAAVNDLTFKKNFGRISPIVVLPDSIELEGPASYLEALGDTLSIKAQGSRINAHYRENLEVTIDHSEFISRNPPVVEVMFEVGPVIEVSSRLRLTLPKNSGMILDDDSITCLMIIPQRDAEQYTVDQPLIQATIPQITLAKGDTARLRPLVTGIPSYATVFHIDSIEVRRIP